MDFIAFFAKGSCTITAEADTVVAEFADEATKGHGRHFVVEGNAGKDEGVDTKVIALSRCRAEAVRADLVHHGLDATKIDVIAKGSSEPISELRGGTPEMDRRALMYQTE